MTIRIIPLTDNWALRRHAICVRNFAALPAHAKRLVECMRKKPFEGAFPKLARFGP
jgi:hypothetical protein